MIKRKLVARSILAVVYIGIGVLAFVTGRSHKVFLDNPKDASAYVSFSVDGQKPIRVRPNGCRVMEAKGPSHHLKIEFEDGTAPIETHFHITPFTDAVLFSVAALNQGAPPHPQIVPGDTEEH